MTSPGRFRGIRTDITVHLDRGYDSTVTRTLLHDTGFTGVIARKGIFAPRPPETASAGPPDPPAAARDDP